MIEQPVRPAGETPCIAVRSRGIAGVLLGLALLATAMVLAYWIVLPRLQNPDYHFGPKRSIGFVVAAAFAGLGMLAIAMRRRIKGRYLAFATVPIILLLLFTEAGFRLYQGVQRAIWKRYDFKAYAGWGPTAYTKRESEVKGFGKIKFSTGKYGFRVWGDPATTRTKLLVIGDSYTEGHCFSDGEGYYNQIARHYPNVELFAYGAGGFGTTQEYMMLDHYVDEIKPDILLWQFCANDIVNNDYVLEYEAPFRIYRRRPFLVDDHIEWLYPRETGNPLYWLVQHSYLLQFIEVRLAALKPFTADYLNYRLSETDPKVVRALNTTDRLMGMVRKRVGNIPIVAFCVNDVENIAKPLPQICARHGIKFVPDVSKAVETVRLQGKVTDGRPYDSHWNALGQQIAGNVLIDYLDRERVLPGARETTSPSVRPDRPAAQGAPRNTK